MAAGRDQGPPGGFGPAVSEWFAARHGEPTRVQALGWPRIASGEHALLCAPTGSGKTLAAFLACLDRLGRSEPVRERGPVLGPRGQSARGTAREGSRTTRVVYVSPLKALAYDIERNLGEPLAEIAALAVERGLAFHPPTVAVRTGDTSPAARRRQLREPPDILITTPESLYLLLTSSARDGLVAVETVIVDEIHALAPNKRGAHLALSLERLSAIAAREPQRIGLSATQRPLEEVARFLGGDRPVAVVDAGEVPRIDVHIEVPAADMSRPGGDDEDRLPGLSPEERTSLMPALYRRVFELVQAHTSSIVFVNSRRLAERVAHQLNEMAGHEMARAHHGSMARGERLVAEDLLKRGLLRCIAATSSLELGIDMASVDLVVQVESPGSVARGLQRIGRAGHQVGATSKGAILPKYRGDLLEAAVVCRGMQDGAVEPIRVPRQPIDVLAQQIVAMCAVETWPVGELASRIRRAHPYRDLSAEALAAVLSMLSGGTGDDMSDLTPRLAWDRTADTVVARRGARLVALTSGGTIPDRGLYAVHLGHGGPRVGELDEEMVYESRAGETFLLGATTWRIEEIERDRVIVSPAPGEPGKMPFWKGDRPPRPPALGRALGALVREIGEQDPARARALLADDYRLDPNAIENALAYVAEQREATGTLPTDRAITVERFRDELGDTRVCVLSPMGGAVHGPWALAIEAELGGALGAPVQAMWNDDGIAFRLPASAPLPGVEQIAFDPAEIEDRVTAELGGSALFASRFRENAARALLLPRRRPGQRAPLWIQRLRAQQLLGAAQRQPSFPILIETYREILADVFDLPALIELMTAIRRGELRVDVVDTTSPSPFARSLAFAYTIAFMYEGDAPPIERRAQALALDRGLLRDLLGHEDMRRLLDGAIVDQVDRERQRLAPDRRARDADEVHDLLRRLGDLDEDEIAERAAGDARAWIADLERQGRAVRLEVGGRASVAAAEDIERYRAAAAGDDDALDSLLVRGARQRGPLAPDRWTARFGVAPARGAAAIDRLVASGQLERGGFRPGGAGVEVVHPEVLRELRRRTLEDLRRQVQPAAPAALARFLPAWHGIGRGGPGGLPALREAVRRLVGMPLPLSDLEARILPARVSDFHPTLLDQLGATGELLWVGRGRLGTGDGRIALYDRDHLALVGEPAPETLAALSAEPRAVLDALAARGASFQVELEQSSGLAGDALTSALWDLVWAGLVTNDTFAPLRSREARRPRAGAPSRRPRPPPGSRRTAGSVRASPFAGGGRWSLVAQRARGAVDPTERALALALSMLDRYGLVSREAAAAEELPGGFGAIAPVLRVLEETGRVRRGYFAAGLDGRQYALAAAIDRLRAPGPDGAVVLAASDPANPYGALLPWPETRVADGTPPGFLRTPSNQGSGRMIAGGARPGRRAGALVLLWRGEPALTLESGGKAIVTFAALDEAGLAEAVRAGLPSLLGLARRRALRLETIDGAPARSSPLAPLLVELGFRPELRGLSYEPPPR